MGLSLDPNHLNTERRTQNKNGSEVLHRRGDPSSHRERRHDYSPRRDEETEAESSRRVLDHNARNDESTDGDEVSTETERDADASIRSLRDGETRRI
ncbi:hypothetical protein F2Q69_00003197 [Brassica cretica]|uniref:Uncharacterized protein n=1 Tax=Brassica cretica TaxID=69181 RepID=A0A8S9P405_BRACR|nr:hypothetical protein F2Q69_00003197 [Brassica cretica]